MSACAFGNNSGWVGLGRSSSFQNHWSVFANPAGLAFKDGAFSSLTYSNHFLISELDQKIAATTYSKNGRAAGIMACEQGDGRLRYRLIAATYSRRFANNFSMALKFNFFQLRLSDNYGRKYLVFPEFGILTGITQNLWHSVSIANPTRVMVLAKYRERWPGSLNTGLYYQVSPLLTSVIEIEKSNRGPLDLQIGMNYQIHRVVWAEIEYRSKLREIYFNAAIQCASWKLFMNCAFTFNLGFSPSISILYRIGYKER